MEKQNKSNEIGLGQCNEIFLSIIYKNLPLGIILINSTGTIICKNDWIQNYFISQIEDGVKINDIIHDLWQPKNKINRHEQFLKNEPYLLEKEIRQALSTKKPMNRLNMPLFSQGKIKWFKISGNPIFYKEELYVVLFLEDITLFKQQEQRLERKLKLDLATKVLNKQSLLQQIKKLAQLSDETGFTIAMIDFDDFKKVNDCYGHVFGDRVLQIFSKISKKNVRSHDIIGRYGGEEFIFIFNGTDVEAIIPLIQKIQNDLRSYFAKKVSLPITLSAGVMSLDPKTCTLSDCEKIIDQVDSLLYQAKKAGKNQIATCPRKIKSLNG